MGTCADILNISFTSMPGFCAFIPLNQFSLISSISMRFFVNQSPAFEGSCHVATAIQTERDMVFTFVSKKKNSSDKV